MLSNALPETFAAVAVPYAYVLIFAATGQLLAIGAKGDCPDHISMAA